MIRPLALIALGVILTSALFPQLNEPVSKFDVADVHGSRGSGRFMRGPFVGGGRYEVYSASMLDLVRNAYGVDNDKIYGGPSWLEADRFDIVAKLPPGTNAESRKTLLQGLLADRFKLVVHNDTKPMPAYALTAGKHGGLKEADTTAEPGCKFDLKSDGPALTTPGEAQGMMVPMVFVTCHNTTMTAFADQLYRMIGVPQALGNKRIVDKTGLEGAWDFSFKYSLSGIIRIGGAAVVQDNTTPMEALDKQVGLKLEPSNEPTAVLVVDSVNRTPSANSAEALKSLPPTPTEFEVAEIKPSAPGSESNGQMILNGQVVMVARKVGAGGRGGVGPAIQNGRVNLTGMTLRDLILQAWDLTVEKLVGAPKFAETDRYDVIAKIPSGAGAYEGNTDMETVRPMLQALLVEKFKITFHKEDRPANAYVLTATKAKMKAADPAGRTKCQLATGPATAANANSNMTRTFVCTNMTMADFSQQIQNMGPAYIQNAPVVDETHLEGAFDFSVSFSTAGAVNMGGRGGPVDVSGGPSASDPTGGISLFDAISKQLGLKLEQQKRNVPVMVIDHIEPKPVEN